MAARYHRCSNPPASKPTHGIRDRVVIPPHPSSARSRHVRHASRGAVRGYCSALPGLKTQSSYPALSRKVALLELGACCYSSTPSPFRGKLYRGCCLCVHFNSLGGAIMSSRRAMRVPQGVTNAGAASRSQRPGTASAQLTARLSSRWACGWVDGTVVLRLEQIRLHCCG